MNNRLHISLTKVYDGCNLLASQFSSKHEVIQVEQRNCPPVSHFLLQVILASAFIPVFSGLSPPRYRGCRVIGRYVDDNSPHISLAKTRREQLRRVRTEPGDNNYPVDNQVIFQTEGSVITFPALTATPSLSPHSVAVLTSALWTRRYLIS